MFSKKLIKLIDGSIKNILLNVCIQWIGLICNIATIFSIGFLLNSILDNTLNNLTIIKCLIICLVGISIRFCCSIYSAKLSNDISIKVKLTLRSRLFDKLFKLGPSYHQLINTSQAVQVAVEGVDQLEIYFGKYLPQLFYSLLAPLTLFFVLAPISFSSALVLVFCVPLIPISIIAVQKFAKKLLSKYWGDYTNLGDSFLENLQGLTTLKIFGCDEQKNIEMNEKSEIFRKITMKVLVMQLNSITLMDLIAFGGAALGVIVAITNFSSGKINFFGCFCIILLAAEFFIPLRLLGSFFHIAMNGMAASDQIFNILEIKQPLNGTVKTLEDNFDIKFNSVYFAYNDDQTVLKDLHLKINKGITAIVGESGSGKSTIASLITAQFKRFGGQITLGEIDINSIDSHVLARTITLVGHESYIFKGSVRDNLLMARPKADDIELISVLKQVNLFDFLSGEKGLDTLLNEQGSNLSGGQRQRLALARALLYDSPIYIFDEATSNIDVESEDDIMKVIYNMGHNKSVLVISHRLTNVVDAGRIYLIKNGEITEQGTHEKLMKQEGFYAQMFTSQKNLESFGRREQEYEQKKA